MTRARELADGVFRPRAQDADQGDIHGQVGENIRLLAEAGYFGLGISAEHGGLGADEETRREYAELMASACGVTAFVQQQLHAGGFVGGAPDEAFRREMLPQFASGKKFCGVAFAHLRRPGPPTVTAERVSGGFLVNGVAPWVTGWSLLDGFSLGAVMADEHLFVYVPKEGNEKALTPGPRIPLAVMNASDTVQVTMTDLFVPERALLSVRPTDALRQSDHCGITGHVYLPLGCARGSIDYLRALAEKRANARLIEVADAFAEEVDRCRAEALAWTGACANLPEYKERALHARASAIVLAVRAAHAAVTATGGSAHLLTQPPQRLLREAIFYTTTAQTQDVQAETLDLLVSPDCWRA
ncbi:acyl-CoA dehydrogenase [Capsulimonas corticalis]|uniref:Acyl-CoA dehydrogenase n=1 Tax=Capsulimonas corticalis TaxID=2219043 RepID=A0A402CQ41_9BACT|nr:acyl-CoA dehydrogenase family protein [Capsulimonas corticalis]BDI32844.1 acyl-CoA dehydrogenase [Capsulimonas corticalis]